MRKYIFLSVFIVFLLLVQSVTFYYFITTYDSRMQQYKVTERSFTTAVTLATTQYLSSVVGSLPSAPSNEPILQTRTNTPPAVVLVPALTTWADYTGRFSMLLHGAKYQVGDFCEFGLIRHIRPGAVYCFNGATCTILRSTDKEPDKPRPRLSGTLEDDAL